jgi:hypothetical protein
MLPEYATAAKVSVAAVEMHVFFNTLKSRIYNRSPAFRDGRTFVAVTELYEAAVMPAEDGRGSGPPMAVNSWEDRLDQNELISVEADQALKPTASPSKIELNL